MIQFVWYDIEAAENEEGFLCVFDFIAYPSSVIKLMLSDSEAAENEEGFLCVFDFIAYPSSVIKFMWSDSEEIQEGLFLIVSPIQARKIDPPYVFHSGKERI